MQRFLFYVTMLLVALGLTMSGWAEIVYFNANNEKITQEEYQKLSESWQMKAKENIAQREVQDTNIAEGSEGSKAIQDPVQIRKKRIEQWKAYRGEI